MHITYFFRLSTLLIFVFFVPAAVFSAVSALPSAHSHNDYEHNRPLFDALDNGFCSVEADIFLVNGELLVGHTREDLKTERTLESLYLKPLLERVRKNHGRVFSDAPVFYLWIEFKSAGDEAYPVLQKQLAKYDEMLTSFDGGKVNRKAILVVTSGARPADLVRQEKGRRYMTLDGYFSDLDGNTSPDLIPVVSGCWGDNFKWNGEGTMPEDQMKLLNEHLARAHQQGRKVRYWAAPDTQSFWEFCDKTGIDLINTDHLEGLRSFLIHNGQKQPVQYRSKGRLRSRLPILRRF